MRIVLAVRKGRANSPTNVLQGIDQQSRSGRRDRWDPLKVSPPKYKGPASQHYDDDWHNAIHKTLRQRLCPSRFGTDIYTNVGEHRLVSRASKRLTARHLANRPLPKPIVYANKGEGIEKQPE